ncbi:hypothetical protein SDRG_17101 [Saprolegnia diclina VS20]|uniref:Uncharacterized protein n=1 Tax=Saprolegnia diclina (strain VS20) TaxID=1156394 RepID=T0PI41_SAPDV|nr:hypothetical protein SDRG_17101 [Saprolegnia diclina VS20]EQC25024.1 hypothetical protein SDRG_17101 [Saprolegnia diclina VS20]|eukprot:XP_008621558.1 hypothetical protein SDRG_17101 [Saprolegnia diclina VS20]
MDDDALVNLDESLGNYSLELDAARTARNALAMGTLDAIAARRVHQATATDDAMWATKVQCAWRRHVAKKVYVDLLWAQYQVEEAQRQAVIRQHVADTTRLLQTLDLQEQLANAQYLAKLRQNHLHRVAYSIQRTYRAHARRKLTLKRAATVPANLGR